jgi:hypothetical protein
LVAVRPPGRAVGEDLQRAMCRKWVERAAAAGQMPPERSTHRLAWFLASVRADIATRSRCQVPRSPANPCCVWTSAANACRPSAVTIAAVATF